MTATTPVSRPLEPGDARAARPLVEHPGGARAAGGRGALELVELGIRNVTHLDALIDHLSAVVSGHEHQSNGS